MRNYKRFVELNKSAACSQQKLRIYVVKRGQSNEKKFIYIDSRFEYFLARAAMINLARTAQVNPTMNKLQMAHRLMYSLDSRQATSSINFPSKRSFYNGSDKIGQLLNLVKIKRSYTWIKIVLSSVSLSFPTADANLTRTGTET